jgi:flotillin
MTKEKLQFLLPVVFTIGPDVNQRGANAGSTSRAAQALGANGSAHDDHAPDHAYDHVVHAPDHSREDKGDALMKYAMLLADTAARSGNGQHNFLDNIVKGIIEGETRVLVSSMTMEEIFTEREEFKRRIFRNIQSELDQFGLKIYNANVKELKDAKGSSYFQSLSQKAHEGATNQAKIDVANAVLIGSVGEADKKGEQEREIAKIHALTAVQKTERDIERANAEAHLEKEKTQLNRNVAIAKIEADRATQNRDEELKREVEVKRAGAEIERLRARDVVKATIDRESKQQAADAKAYEVQAAARADYEREMRATDAAAYKIKVQTETQAAAQLLSTSKAADAAAYKTKLDAETQAAADFARNTKATDALAYKTRTDAEAWSYAATQNAQANLVKKQKEAEGLLAMAEAYERMSHAFGGPKGLLTYMMLQNNTFVDLAKANATAVQGMQPKISVWNTGATAGAGDSAANGQPNGVSSMDTMRNVYQMLPPLMTTINEQTGITLPEWQFGRMAGQMSEAEREKAIAKTNGTH